MEEPIHTETYRGYTIRIHPDQDPQSPREDESFGTMVCFHKRYSLGDEHQLNHDDYAGWDDMEGHLVNDLDAAVILPLYIYDHGGITMSTGKFSCPWDSGQVGFIYVTREKLLLEQGGKRVTKEMKANAEIMLRNEVKAYDHYLQNNVYGYTIEDPEGDELDSCWGFIGDYDDKDYSALQEARVAVDGMIQRALEARMKASLTTTGMEE